MNGDDEIYRGIEKRYGFVVPEEYRRVKLRGWFDRPDGTMPDFDPMTSSYLWMNEMEWMPLHDIRDFEFPSYCKPGFVPFAFTGGGDHWCWYPEHTSHGNTPVVICWRDSKIGEFYAPHFLGSVYRQILDFATEPLQDEPEVKQHLNRWLNDLGPFFPARWTYMLAMLLNAPLRTWEYGKVKRLTRTGLLPPDEYNRIVHDDLAFDKLDQEFQWMFD